MQITQHTTMHYTPARSPKPPPLGVVLHNTVTQTLVAPHPAGSWHYEIGRDGACHQYVPDRDLAWHVRATDEWRPGWLRWRDTRVSEANSCTVGIELVSYAGNTAGVPVPEPYTPAQYATLRELLALLYARYGVLPVVTHGAMQLDRTDPVGFDFARAGLVWAGDGYRLEEATDVPITETTEAERAAMKPYFEQLGVPVNMSTALMKRAALAKKREETRGPATSGEYTHANGRPRQNFTAGTCEFDPATGGVNWVELNLEG